MGTIERPVRQALVRATLHLVNRRARGCAGWGRGARAAVPHAECGQCTSRCTPLLPNTTSCLCTPPAYSTSREYSELAQDFLDLGLLPKGSDMAEIVPALTGVFQKALSGGVSNLSFGSLSGAQSVREAARALVVLLQAWL